MEICNGLHAFIWREMMANNCNTYLIQGNQNILIDPGHKHLLPRVEQELAALELTPEQIDLVMVTHGHSDHLEGAARFEKPTLVALSREEKRFVEENAGHFAVPGERDTIEPDIFLQEGELQVGDLTFQIISTPGHSPGSMSILWPDKKALFTGDVIFGGGGIGRTDLPEGNGKVLKESIQKLRSLDVEYVLPGHGEIIKGKKSVADNFETIEAHWFGYLI